MSINVILVLVLAGLIHGVWNFLAKQSLHKPVFLWMALVAGSIIFMVPFLSWYRGLSLGAWILVAISGVLEALYFFLLGTSYKSGDLSLIFPIARGSAPVFVVGLSFLFLKERFSLFELAGILAIVSGIFVIHLRRTDPRRIVGGFSFLKDPNSRLALLTGLTTACYSIVDKIAVQRVDPRLYIYLILSVAAIVLAPYMLLRSSMAVREEWAINKKAIVGVAILFFCAYFLVLRSLATNNVSPVASVREVSVVFAVLIGVFVLREPFGKQKLIGSLFIFSGIVCIAFAR